MSKEQTYYCPSCGRHEFIKPQNKAKTVFLCGNHEREWCDKTQTYIKTPTFALIDGVLSGPSLAPQVFRHWQTGYTAEVA